MQLCGATTAAVDAECLPLLLAALADAPRLPLKRIICMGSLPPADAQAALRATRRSLQVWAPPVQPALPLPAAAAPQPPPPPQLELQLAQPDDGTALICFTSGTTGLPKGVALSHRAFHCQSLCKLAAARYSADDVYLHVAPLFHVGGLSSAFAMLMAGAAHVFMPRCVALSIVVYMTR